MDGNPIKVGYYDPFDVFPVLEKQVENKLPLLNLYWRHAPNKPAKAILNLPVQFVPEIPKRTPTNVYLHMAVFQCSAIDTYRTQVRPLIKEWLRLVVSPDNVEWIIILFVPKNTKDLHLGLMKLLIIDKLRVDFGVDGKELPEGLSNREAGRILKIKEHYEDPGKRSDVLNDYITLIKKCLLTSFTTRYQVYSTLQSLQGRLSLAELFKDMRLYDESLNTYALLSTHKQAPTAVSIPNDLSAYKFRNLDSISQSFKEQDAFLYRSKLFLEQADLLILLADLVKDNAVATKYLASLYQKLLTFLQNIVSQAPGAKAAEWAYAVADSYLDINTLVDVEKIPVVLGYRGELRLFQRSQLMKLGKLSYKYKIYGAAAITSEVDFDDINLNDIDNDMSSVTTKEPSPITYGPLKVILASETSFYDKFQDITEHAIRDFHSSSRQNSVDVLSMDIALIKFYRKQYKEALEILSNSYAYFLQNGWKFMGGILLEAYLMCLEKIEEVPDYAKLLKMCLQLLGILYTQKSGNGINNYGLLKDTQKVKLLLDKVTIYSGNLDRVFQSNLSDIFTIEVIPIIEGDRHLKADNYFIEVEVSNKFPVDINVQAVAIFIQNDSATIKFEHGPCKIVKNSSRTTLKLISRSFIRGHFSIKKVSLFPHQNLELIQEFYEEDIFLNEENTIDGDNSVLCTRPMTVRKSKSEVYFLNQKGKLRLQFQNPAKVKLGHNEMILRIHSGMCDITELQVFIKSKTSGFIFSYSEVVEANEHCLLNDDSLISLPNVEATKEYALRIPYTCFNGEKLIQMSAALYYNFNGEKYIHEINDSIDISLSLSVSVLDIFKKNYIFSNFQVGPSNSRRPIRITSTSLTATGDEYSVIQPVVTSNRIVAFTELPASFFFKIEPKKDYQIDPEDSFELEVQYQNVYDELTRQFEDLISSKFADNSIDYYFYFIKDQIISKLEFDINRYSQKGVIKILNNRIMRIVTPSIIDKHVLKGNHRTILLEMFMELFEDEREWEPASSELQADMRTLIISVPIPVLKVLHIVEYSCEKQAQYTVGESVPIKVTVTTSRRWCSKKYENKSLSDKQEEQFQLSIVPDENWLISGFKNKIFNIPHLITAEESSTFDFVFTPLNVGRILLPKVDIQFAADDEDGATMDIIYKNGLESLLVVPEIGSITFSF